MILKNPAGIETYYLILGNLGEIQAKNPQLKTLLSLHLITLLLAVGGLAGQELMPSEIAAAAILQLQDRGLLDMQAPVSTSGGAIESVTLFQNDQELTAQRVWQPPQSLVRLQPVSSTE